MLVKLPGECGTAPGWFLTGPISKVAILVWTPRPGQRRLMSEEGAVCVQPLQSCPTLCDPLDCSPPGSSVHGMSQARVLGWVARALSSRGCSRPQDGVQSAVSRGVALGPAVVPPMEPGQRQCTLPRPPVSPAPLPCPQHQTSHDEAPAPWGPSLVTVAFGAAAWGPWPCSGLLPAPPPPLPGDLAASASPGRAWPLSSRGDWARITTAAAWPSLQGPFLSQTRLASLIQWT